MAESNTTDYATNKEALPFSEQHYFSFLMTISPFMKKCLRIRSVP